MKKTFLVPLWVLGLAATSASESPPALTTLEVPGVLKPSQVVELAAAVDGVLEEAFVDWGDFVEEGQVLARLQRDVAAANAEIARVRALQDSAEQMSLLQTREAERKLDALLGLYQEDLLPEDQLEDARAEWEMALLSQQQAREALLLAELESHRAEALLDQLEIRSPFAGVVLKRYLSVGELVSRSGQASVLRVACLDPLQVEVSAPASFFGRIPVGLPVNLKVEIPSSQTLAGIVTVVDPVIDAASQTFGVRIELRNPEFLHPAGVECTVRFPW